MSGSYVIGIDLGTSQAKGGVFRPDTGECLGKHVVGYQVQYPHPDWAEMDADTWWSAVKDIIRASVQASGIRGTAVAAIGISGLVPSCLPLDGSGRPVRPAILWLDRRSTSECEQIASVLGQDQAIRLGGNMINPYFLAPKLLWYRNNEPEAFGRTRHIVQAHAYVVYRLTGEISTDFSSAALSGPLFDLQCRQWAESALEALGIPRDVLPPIVPSHTVVGKLTPEAASELGLSPDTVVVSGAGDYATSCLSAGVTKPGEVCMMLGTAGNILAPLPAPGTDPRLVNAYHCVPDTPLTFGSILAGGAIKWFVDSVASRDPNPMPDPFETLTQEAVEAGVGANGLVALTYLMGERTPIWNPHARGVLFGLRLDHHRGHIFRALLEGVAFGFRQMLDILAGQGVSLTAIRAINGGARSPLWRQILADVTGVPLVYIQKSEGAPLGAAILAAMGAGLVSSAEGIKEHLPIHSVTEPDPERHEQYGAFFQVYRSIYEHTRDDLEELRSALSRVLGNQ